MAPIAVRHPDRPRPRAALPEQRDQQQTLEATEAAYKLAEERYRAGLASYLSVLNAETQVLAARQSMVDILTSQAVARVTVLLAIGGSFDPRASGVLAAAHTAANSSDLLTRVSP